jgi:chaperonin cofactor prefoldin
MLINYEGDLIEKRIALKREVKRLQKQLTKVNEELEGVQFTLHALYADELY